MKTCKINGLEYKVGAKNFVYKKINGEWLRSHSVSIYDVNIGIEKQKLKSQTIKNTYHQDDAKCTIDRYIDRVKSATKELCLKKYGVYAKNKDVNAALEVSIEGHKDKSLLMQSRPTGGVIVPKGISKIRNKYTHKMLQLSSKLARTI